MGEPTDVPVGASADDSRVGARATSRQARAFTAAFTMSVAAPLPLLLAGTLAVQLRDDIGLDTEHIGAASALFFLCSSMISIVAGAFTDRVGWQWAVRGASAVSVVAFLLVASFASGVGTFFPLFIIGSFAHAISGPAGNVAISSEMPVQRLGLLFGLKQSANPLANILAGASVPLVGLTLGWRWAFVMGAVFPLLAIVATFGSAGPSHTTTRRRVPPGLGASAGPTGVIDQPGDVRLRTLPIVVLALAGGLATCVAGALGAYVVLSAVEAGISEGTAGVYVMFAAATGLTTRVVGGWWADRAGSSGILPVATLLAVGVFGHMALATGESSLVLPGTLLAYGAGWGWPGLLMYTIAHHYRRSTGRVTGRVQIGMMLGGVVGPLTFALLQLRWGYGAGWLSVAAASALGAGLTVLAAILLRRGVEAPVTDQSVAPVAMSG